MNFKKWVKSIQTAGYNGVRMVIEIEILPVGCSFFFFAENTQILLKISVIPTLSTFMYRTRAIMTRGLYTFYPLFEVHLCTVTFGLMYG